MKHYLLLFVASLSALLLSTSVNAQITPANNKLGLAVYTPPQNPAFDFDSCFHLGQVSGMNEYQFSLDWSTLEPTAGTFDFAYIDVANYYFPLYNMPVNLVLAPISTNVNELPADLTSYAFNDTVMINRFNALLDSIKIHAPAITFSSLVIGNEIDVYLGNSASAWANYTTFLVATSAHAQTLWPGIKIACKITFNGLVNNPTAPYAQQINTYCDYIGTTYYPLNPDFTVKPVSVIPTDFDTIVSAYPNKPICFYECGYPSSTACNSSDSLQKEFITQIFTSWDAYSANIRLVDFLWLHDLDTATINFFALYYGSSDTVFLEYLRTLGLRTWGGNGTDKPAFTELQCQARQRGYNTLNMNCTTGIPESTESSTPLVLAPNPAQNDLSIQPSVILNDADVKIFNSSGQLVMNITAINQSEIHINTSELNSGVYFLVVKNGKDYFNNRFVITR
ncbi:MAG: T9SS type A sorting domain-containing protein [Bacteroidetes bacterium]|nr:T9SS type A sorting domain-containing protein [Bacteroidota bacterium]